VILCVFYNITSSLYISLSLTHTLSLTYTLTLTHTDTHTYTQGNDHPIDVNVCIFLSIDSLVDLFFIFDVWLSFRKVSVCVCARARACVCVCVCLCVCVSVNIKKMAMCVLSACLCLSMRILPSFCFHAHMFLCPTYYTTLHYTALHRVTGVLRARHTPSDGPRRDLCALQKQLAHRGCHLMLPIGAPADTAGQTSACYAHSQGAQGLSADQIDQRGERV
jgi:hypothetical protein